jgi:His-Xaa-Ser system protein HxsD
MSALADLPDHLVSLDLGEASVTLTVDAEIYPLDALYAAAFVFIDRCYVFLDKPAPSRYRVVLSARGEVDDPAALRALVGEFSNELLACAWRQKITEDNRLLIETVTMQAIGTAMGAPSLDDLANFDFTDEGLDDPLQIAQSREAKHSKKPQTSAADEPDGDEQ